jgi:hypothetical protein
MLTKRYSLYENFIRVYPQFIDIRLIDKWINTETDKDHMANTITHLLIYHDALSFAHIDQIEIIDTLGPIKIATKTIYAFNNINFTYSITIPDIKKIINKQPLHAPIEKTLVDLLGYRIKNMGISTTKTDVWTEVFAK